MAKSTAAKYFSSAMQGAPGVASAAGNLTSMLDAILVNGFNERTLDGISVTDEIATATRAAGHGYWLDQVVLISGATPSGLNGEKRILSITNTTFTFDAEGLADGNASGTITAKTAPAGWEKPFSKTNVSVYRSPNPLSPRSFYRVSAESSVIGIITAYEAMTDVDTGSEQWGTQYVQPNYKIYWMAWADDRTVWFLGVRQSYSQDCYIISGFGDYVPFSPDDMPEFIKGCENKSTSTSGGSAHGPPFSSAYGSGYMALHRTALNTLGGSGIGARTVQDSSGIGGPSFPSPVDNGLMLADAIFQETATGGAIRGRCRGAYWVLASSPFQTVNPAQTFEGVAGLEGRTISMGWCQDPKNVSSSAAGNSCRVAFDVTGPWEA